MDATGANAHSILNTPTMVVEDPDWSPDGTRILVSISDAVTGDTRIATISPDGTNLTYVTELRNSIVSHRHPRWSPDGQRFLYTESGVLWVADADGTNRFHVIQPQTFGNPSWSPDGEWILFGLVDVAREGLTLRVVRPVLTGNYDEYDLLFLPAISGESMQWYP